MIIEHFAGAFPVWLAPMQAVLISIFGRHNDYAVKAAAQLRETGLRVEVDGEYRPHRNQKIPYVLVIGDKEAKANAVAVRLRLSDDLGAVPMAGFIARAQTDVETGV